MTTGMGFTESERVRWALNGGHDRLLNPLTGNRQTADEHVARRRAQIEAAVDQLVAEATNERNQRLLTELRRRLPNYLRRHGLDARIDALLARVPVALPPA